MKKVYLVHGWGGNPDNCWFPWLMKQLEKFGVHTESIMLPTPEFPDPVTWPNALKEAVPSPDKETVFVGHSIGCLTIMHYLANLPEQAKVAGVVFVAPWMEIAPQDNPADEKIRDQWRNFPIDIEKFKAKINTSGFTCIFSDNDDAIDSAVNEPIFKAMGAKTIMEHGKGHFSDDAGITELPSALEETLKMIS
jgi:uncharacterized protein